MLFGVLDFGVFYAQNMSLQSAAREGAREGVLQGDVIASARQARGMLTDSKMQVKYTIDMSTGDPGTLVVCVRYPQSSLTGFFNLVLNGVSQSRTVMRMEGIAPTTAGATSNWNGGSCSL